MKLKINMTDTFSFCTEERIIDLHEDKANRLIESAGTNKIFPEFSKKDQIRYNWRIDKAEKV